MYRYTPGVSIVCIELSHIQISLLGFLLSGCCLFDLFGYVIFGLFCFTLNSLRCSLLLQLSGKQSGIDQ